MTLESQGFLDDEILSVVDKNRNDNSAAYALCVEVNQLANTILYLMKVHVEDVQELLVACLFARSVSTYQGSILMIERGMVAEARILIRSLVEIMFRLVAICRDETLAQSYILEDQRQRKKFISKFRTLKERSFEVDQSLLDELEAEIQRQIKEHNIGELKTEFFAKKAGMEDYYKTVYAIFSGTVHTYSRDLAEYLVPDETGKPISLGCGPDSRCLNELFLTAADVMIMILDNLSGFFSLERRDDVRKSYDKLKHLVETTWQK
jgi:hypothetical protein